MDLVLCIVLGYLLGSLNPAALIGKIKHFNLRKHGTGNLGATNVLLNFGKGFAAVVMLFDIFKAFAAFHPCSAAAWSLPPTWQARRRCWDISSPSI